MWSANHKKSSQKNDGMIQTDFSNALKLANTIDFNGSTVIPSGSGNNISHALFYPSISGTIKNLNVEGYNGAYMLCLVGDVVFENCSFKGTVYGCNTDAGNGYTMTFNYCEFTGWNSFTNTVSNISMTDCTFKYSGSYGTLRFYQNAQVTNCIFEENFQWIDAAKSGISIEFNSCTGLTEEIIFNNEGVSETTWTVDDTELDNIKTH